MKIGTKFQRLSLIIFTQKFYFSGIAGKFIWCFEDKRQILELRMVYNIYESLCTKMAFANFSVAVFM